VDSSPAIASNGTIYVGSDDGKLYAITGNGQALAAGAWPQFRQSLVRTGLFPATGAFSNPGRLINLSARASVTASPNNLVVGFVIGGASKSILLRGVGPTLSQFGITAPLSDPILQLFNSSSTMIASDTTGWGGSATLSNAFQQVGAFAYMSSTSLDEALLEPSLSGLYTAQVSPASSSGGVALAEIYDADTGVPPGRLVNISARANVGAGQNMLIAGFVIGGQTAQTVLIRGIGPALANYGISNYLAQPQLTLFRTVNNNPVATAQNTGWSTAPNATKIAATSTSVQAFALASGSADCALLLTLPPGLYTAQVTTGNGASGVALAEVYLVP
jgi:hypothetical protein